MTKASDNIFPKVTFVEGSAPASPSASDFSLYFDVSDHLLKWKNSAGTVTTIATGSSGLADPMTTRGDIITRNASNVTDRLGRGSAKTALFSDGTDVAYRSPAYSDLAFRGAKVYKSGAQTLTDSVETAITFNTEEYDTNTLHDTGSNTSRIVLDTVGYWALSSGGIWTANTAGRRMHSFRINANAVAGAGTLVRGGDQWAAATASGQARVNSYAVFKTTTNTDYAELFVTQTSGGNLDILADSTFEAHFLGV